MKEKAVSIIVSLVGVCGGLVTMGLPPYHAINYIGGILASANMFFLVRVLWVPNDEDK